MTFAKTPAFLLTLALLCATPAAAQQHQLRTEWSKNVTEYRAQNGRRVTLVCPAGGVIGDLWGTDTYTDDSSACSAAAHAGLITPAQGGVVTIVIGPGRKSYAGSHRHGVTSKGFGHTSGSFAFDSATGEGRVDWTTNAKGLDVAGRPVTVVCPAGGTSSTVWGTDTYTDDSSICTAAVHAGAITLASGGRVTLEHVGDQATYAASSRNGVSSREFTDSPNGFRFAAAAAPAPSPQQVGSVAPTSGSVASSTPVAAPTAATTLKAPVGAAPQTSSQTTVVSGTTTAVAIVDRAPTTTRPSGTSVGTVALAAPTNVRAQPLYYRGTVMVQWDTMPGATGYDILQLLPDGKYAGANPIGRGPYGPERSQGITMELAPVPLSFSVVAHYGPDQTSPPSAPSSVVIPRWYGRYRVSILGFKVERETSDDPLETDGKRDEVYLRAAAAERGPDGERIGSVVERQTLVHGDINTTEWRSATSPNRRIRAGSASADGGLKTGDAFPTATPWQRTMPNVDRSFPLLLWEGELFQGQNSVQVAFNLWESDQRPGQSVPSYSSFSPEASALEKAAPASKRLEPTVAGKVVTAAAAGVVLAPTVVPLLVLASPALVPTVALGMAIDKVAPRLPVLPKASTPLDALADEVGLTALELKAEGAIADLPNTLAVAVGDFITDQESFYAMLLNAKDRPLGVYRNARSILTALPGTLTLNFENAESEALAGNGPAGKGPGIYEYRFVDKITEQGGNGIYVVYLQVERIQ